MVSLTDPKALVFYRVLVVEDEYFLADDMAKALHKLGPMSSGLRPAGTWRWPCLRPSPLT